MDMKKMTPQAAVKTHEKRMHPGKAPSFKQGGGVKVRGTGAATKGKMARGPMA
jgi:hypothetical protein